MLLHCSACMFCCSVQLWETEEPSASNGKPEPTSKPEHNEPQHDVENSSASAGETAEREDGQGEESSRVEETGRQDEDLMGFGEKDEKQEEEELEAGESVVVEEVESVPEPCHEVEQHQLLEDQEVEEVSKGREEQEPEQEEVVEEQEQMVEGEPAGDEESGDDQQDSTVESPSLYPAEDDPVDSSQPGDSDTVEDGLV